MGHVPQPEILFIDIICGSLSLEAEVREALALMMPQPTYRHSSFLRDSSCWNGDQCERIIWKGHGSGATFQSLMTVLQAMSGAADLSVRWNDGRLVGLRVVGGYVTRHAVGKMLLSMEPQEDLEPTVEMNPVLRVDVEE